MVNYAQPEDSNNRQAENASMLSVDDHFFPLNLDAGYNPLNICLDSNTESQEKSKHTTLYKIYD